MTYNTGQIVQLRADPNRQGAIIEILPPIGGVRKYRVFHSSGYVGEYFENQLDLAPTRAVSDLASTLLQGDLSSSDEFRARITAARLSTPQTDSLYSLYAARIQHIPFQFKPLLRFLRADRPRLLIADEVGVGKTIEAGLILRELQARQEVENVLIVCPKALVSKWKFEMERFDEDFRPLSPEILQYCIKETNLDGVWPSQYARSIVHLELLQNAQYISIERQIERQKKRERKQKILKKKNLNQFPRGLKDLNPPPHFSLVIFDEAHHLRNPGTYSYEIAQFLCKESEAVILLTATPVHLGSKNLHTLLNLLRPDALPDFAVFQQIMEPNSHLINSMRHIRTRSPEQNWQNESLSAIKKAMDTVWGKQVLRNDPIAVKWTERLSRQGKIDEEERIRLLRDLEELLPLSHLINRTRRRDIQRFTTREPRTAPVPFTQPQKEFYDALIDFRRQVLKLKYDERVIRLITNTVERQASSCLPALIPMLDNFIRTGRFSSEEVTDDLELDEDTPELPPSLVDMARDLRNQADNIPSDDDPKLEKLTEIISEVLEISTPKKVLVFSYFLHTLTYLEKKLSHAGYRVSRITGKTQEEDRHKLRKRFRSPNEDPEAIDILLSSEVGCEGLDYEFCDCLVNYDIPWNPMKVEQRIGRIDRFGQKSDKVLIYNFITPGTVEERIFFRCYERLKIFRNTIGDLEEVLGQTVRDLQRLAYNPVLTIEQAEEKARQVADNVIRRADEQRRLEEESESLLGLDRASTEEVDTLIDAGRFVAQNDLAQMVNLYVEQDKIGGKIMPDRQKPGRHHRLRLNKEARSAISDNASVQNRYDRSTVKFKRWLNGNKPTLSITYDQETALEHRDTTFITPVHPLAKAAAAYWKDMSTPLGASLRVRHSTLTVGWYFFILYLWEAVGVQSEVKLKAFAWDINQNKLSEDVSANLLGLFERASDVQQIPSTTKANLQQCIDTVEEVANKERLEAVKQLNQRNEHLLARRLATLESYYRNRLDRVERELNQNTDERIHRMRQAEKGSIESDFERKKTEIEQKRDSDIVSERIAMGILQIEKGS